MRSVRQVKHLRRPLMAPATTRFRTSVSVCWHAWAERHQRPFPWRETSDPYAILVVEIMLRRTRADQVIPVYQRFMARFPTPGPSQALMCRLFRIRCDPWVSTGAFRIPGTRPSPVRWHGWACPRSHGAHSWSSPALGDYVAAAVRMFAFNLPDTLVDTNTVRVAARYLGVAYGAESRRNSNVRAAVARLHDHTQPRRFGQALLDFAALVCRAPTPRCGICPMSARCAYFSQNNAPSEVPA